MSQPISFETAVLAKEAFVKNNFELEYSCICKGVYFLGSKKYYPGEDFVYHRDVSVPAPTQSVLQKWLRDKCDIHVWCEKQHKDVKNIYGFRIGADIEHSVFTFNNWSYEQALEKGLQEAIEIHYEYTSKL